MLESRDAPVVPVVVFERVGFLAVDGVVANLAHLVRHAQRHAADVFDEAHDEGGPHDVPADDEEGADDLQADLPAVACDGSAGVGETKGRAAFLGCPETCMILVSIGQTCFCVGVRAYQCLYLRQWHPRNGCGRHQECHRLDA